MEKKANLSEIEESSDYGGGVVNVKLPSADPSINYAELSQLAKQPCSTDYTLPQNIVESPVLEKSQ
jgi:hypothetical protein